MKTPVGKMKMGVLAAAVQGALFAMSAMPVHAEETDVAALTTPDNHVEIGVAYVDKNAPKFGEYTGLDKKGTELIGNFSVKGGDGYRDVNGLTRWSVSGSNLGLDSRELNANVSKQGQWNFGVGYDELQHNTTTGYQTPYLGSMGGNNFVLPATFGTTGNTATGNGISGLTAPQQALFRTVDVSNTRKNTSFNAGYEFSPQWRVTFDFNNLEQSGAKLMAFSSDGMIAGNANHEKVAILPNPTNYTTNTINLALDWTGENGHLTAAYHASIFKDNYDRVNWQNYWGVNTSDWMSTAPGNQLHQFLLSGGYKLTLTTKLTGSLSYGRNTQDDDYVAAPQDLFIAPAKTSLDGKVITTHADLKLVNQTTKDLKLSAGVIYNKRDNQTISDIYNYQHIGNGGYEIPNTPYSYDKTQYELAGDFRLGKSNKIRMAYNRDEMKRWCNSYGVDAAYPAGTNCVVDTATKEDKLSLGYKLKAIDAVDLSLGYVYSDRKTDYDTNARVALDSLRGSTNLLTGNNLGIAGINGGDYPGFHPIYDASRTQQLLKAGVSWDVNDKLTLAVNGRYADDNYTDATFGAQEGTSWNLNLDATFNYSDNGSVFGYISQDYRDRYVKHTANSWNNAHTTWTAYVWGDKLKDQGVTLGFGFKQGGLMGGKLDLKGDLAYSDAKSNYSSDFLQWISGTTTATSCSAATALTCGSAPDITNKLTQFKLTGTYKVDKQSKIALAYLYQKLSSTDYFYNAYLNGYTATSVLPTNQQSGSYSVNLIAASYIYNFK